MERLKMLIVITIFILSLSLRDALGQNDPEEKCVKCNMDGTEYCEDGYCHCSKSFMGPLCKIKRNPCEEGYKKEPGKRSCGQGVRGDCVPQLGSEIYSCTCKKSYKDDPHTPWPDCILSPDEANNKILGFNKSTALGIAIPVVILFLLIWGIAAAVGIRYLLKKRNKKAQVESSRTSLGRHRSKLQLRSYSSLIRQSQESLERPVFSD